jgi:hypothetical protein
LSERGTRREEGGEKRKRGGKVVKKKEEEMGEGTIGREVAREGM